MTSKRLKGIIIINLICGFAFLVAYIVFFFAGIWSRNLYILATAISIPYIVFCFISYRNIKFYPILPFFLNTMLIILLCAGQGNLKLTVFLIVPVILAMYYGSKSLNLAIIIYNIAIYIIYPFYYSVFVVHNPMPTLIILPIVAEIPYAIEVLSVVALSKRFLIDSEQIKKENEILASEAFRTTNLTVETYKTIIKARNFYFAKHIENVAAYSEIILNELEKLPEYKEQITPDYKRYVVNGAILHDIGKLNLPDELINKFGELEDDELDIIREIPLRGYEIFQTFNQSAFSSDEKEVIENIIIQHQELLNGTGYPKHLFNRQISLEAQIVSIADYIDSGLMNIPGMKPREFNSVYMELITKGYEAYNQTIVNSLYEHSLEIIEYSENCNKEIKAYQSKL